MSVHETRWAEAPLPPALLLMQKATLHPWSWVSGKKTGRFMNHFVLYHQQPVKDFVSFNPQVTAAHFRITQLCMRAHFITYIYQLKPACGCFLLIFHFCPWLSIFYGQFQQREPLQSWFSFFPIPFKKVTESISCNLGYIKKVGEICPMVLSEPMACHIFLNRLIYFDRLQLSLIKLIAMNKTY